MAIAFSVLAIPVKRMEHRLVGYLTRLEVDALLAIPDRANWKGRRDHALLLTLYNSGARVSEIAAVRRSDLTLGAPAPLKLHGKGRIERAVPLWRKTAQTLGTWLEELAGQGTRFSDLVFPSARARPLSRHGIFYLLADSAKRAAIACPSLASKHVSPHVIRHYVPFPTMSRTER